MGRVGKPDEIAALAVYLGIERVGIHDRHGDSHRWRLDALKPDTRSALIGAAVFLAIFGIVGFFLGPGILISVAETSPWLAVSDRRHLHRGVFSSSSGCWSLSGSEEGLMRVLVTGAAGMIGRKLVARLMREEAIGDRAIKCHRPA